MEMARSLGRLGNDLRGIGGKFGIIQDEYITDVVLTIPPAGVQSGRLRLVISGI
jgi:hypothetical protein